MKNKEYTNKTRYTINRKYKINNLVLFYNLQYKDNNLMQRKLQF